MNYLISIVNQSRLSSDKKSGNGVHQVKIIRHNRNWISPIGLRASYPRVEIEEQNGLHRILWSMATITPVMT